MAKRTIGTIREKNIIINSIKGNTSLNRKISEYASIPKDISPTSLLARLMLATGAPSR